MKTGDACPALGQGHLIKGGGTSRHGGNALDVLITSHDEGRWMAAYRLAGRLGCSGSPFSERSDTRPRCVNHTIQGWSRTRRASSAVTVPVTAQLTRDAENTALGVVAFMDSARNDLEPGWQFSFW